MSIIKRMSVGVVFVLSLVTLGMLLFFSNVFDEMPEQQSRQQVAISELAPPAGDLSQPLMEPTQGSREQIGGSASLAKAIFEQPIYLYGLIVDQFGHPIKDASIRLGLHDKPWENGSDFSRVSDSNGRFSIKDLRGAALNVEVLKEGYYNGDESRRVFKPGELSSDMAPFVFILYKKGVAEPVIYHSVAAVRLSKNIAGAHFDFNNGRFLELSDGRGGMFVEIDSSSGLGYGRYWRYSITIKGGGLIKRTHEFAFSAPESGYVESIAGEYGGQPSPDSKWRSSFSEEYFAILPDNTRARFKIELGSKRSNYIRISDLIYNPDPKSINLEFDPAMAINK